MKYNYDGYNWLVRLERGDKLIDCLTKLAQEQNIAGAWVSGLGTAVWAELGFFDVKNQKYNWQRFEHLEITSLAGNVSWDGKQPTLHIHGSFSGEDMSGLGVHVKELEVAATCEVLLHRWYGDKLTRKLDGDTGLKQLDL